MAGPHTVLVLRDEDRCETRSGRSRSSGSSGLLPWRLEVNPDRAHIPGARAHGNMHLPSPQAWRPMLADLLLAITAELDARAVDEQVQELS